MLGAVLDLKIEVFRSKGQHGRLHGRARAHVEMKNPFFRFWSCFRVQHCLLHGRAGCPCRTATSFFSFWSLFSLLHCLLHGHAKGSVDMKNHHLPYFARFCLVFARILLKSSKCLLLLLKLNIMPLSIIFFVESHKNP